MSLDDRGRRAAQQAHRDAARMNLDPEEYRSSRQRRGQIRAVALSAAFVVVVLLIGALVSPPEEEIAVTTSIPLPEVTTTMLPDATTTTQGAVIDSPGMLGAGWEALDAGPVAGRYRMASAWTDHGLFVWGGHDGYSPDPPGETSFHRDGFLFDPRTEDWHQVAPVPPSICSGGPSRAIWLDGVVFLHVPARPVGCAAGLLYDPVVDAWQPLDAGIFDAMSPETPLVWTGDFLVAPTIGFSYDPFTGEQVEIPEAPRDADTTVHSPRRFHWTGAEVLAIGSGAVYSWAPGSSVWRSLDDSPPPVPDRARDSVWTDEGLLVVNYDMAAAFFIEGATVEWRQPGSLPLRFYECLPQAVSAAGVPVVRMCSGIAIWDAARSSWIPIPLENPVEGIQGSGDMIGTPDALYSVGGPALRRFRIHRDEDGAITPPPTVPIGVMQLRIPTGWELVGSIAPTLDSDGTFGAEGGIGAAFRRIGGVALCTVTSEYLAESPIPEDSETIGHVAVERPGLTPLEGTGYQALPRFVGAAFPDANGSDVVRVQCEGLPTDQFWDRVYEFAAGLWSPWEEAVSIPVGVMQLDLPGGFSLRAAGAESQVENPNGTVGEVVTFVFDGPGGSCLVDAWHGRELTDDQRAALEAATVDGEWLAVRLSGSEPSGYWLVVLSLSDLSDTIWIDCESPDDAETLATSFWLP